MNEMLMYMQLYHTIPSLSLSLSYIRKTRKPREVYHEVQGGKGRTSQFKFNLSQAPQRSVKYTVIMSVIDELTVEKKEEQP